MTMERSRSNTSISTKSNRPLSRASTTSIHSFEQHEQPHEYQGQYSHSQPQQQPHPNAHPLQYTQNAYAPLEPALIQAAHHISQQEQNLSVDHMQQLMAYSADPTQQQQHVAHQGMPAQPFEAHTAHVLQAALGQGQPQPPQRMMSTPVPEVEEKKKKGSASGSATNDKELREMLVRNEGRRLQDVAAEVIATDRTSKAEKSKQLFAMLW